ncbi:MAG: CDP-diacylglycerol--serine O-phosphatidyltransferase [Pseudomonadales bacterium]|jgi:CDP-diacylglycerol--serine O-phosphatidyltransferase|nr:CDP-diacylglycerol--serine O-phosphatidyltransferase [Pseudomonadales bacterium]MDP7595746.1 CDP-diacylglycerol--serine O-phosphatidyltransferase [Pseudomonadales bacterium]HJN51199.1 CDP-diacylglycerol--serine O-phosphatidyltransferase [Pseudomonadales bacterium]|tara:strand:+ start:7288 stop:8094 length:807 start_codon:yes stop_codon:yes gene_type:complete
MIDKDQKSANTVRSLADHLDKKPEKDKKRRRGIYLLPNLITTGALFAGFYSIIASMNGSLEKAAIAIFVAGVLDAMDGRIARLTNTQSAFGVQYDSLSDLVAFGVAPSVLVFNYTLSGLGNLGWMVAFFFMACAALRLARFNTRPDNTSFTGMASPPAAGVLAGIVWLWCDLGHADEVVSLQFSILIAIITASVALLMVSNFRYYSPKGINLKGRVPFFYMLAVILLFVVIFLYPPGVMLTISVVYGLSGPIQALFGKRRRQTAESAP